MPSEGQDGRTDARSVGLLWAVSRLWAEGWEAVSPARHQDRDHPQPVTPSALAFPSVKWEDKTCRGCRKDESAGCLSGTEQVLSERRCDHSLHDVAFSYLDS